MGWCSIRAHTDYRERLSPSLWALVAAALCGPMAALTLTPIDRTLALAAGAVVGVGVVLALVATAPVVEVANGRLRVGAASIEVGYLGDPVPTTGDAARTARGSALDVRAFVKVRGGIDGVVTVPVTDDDDPAPAWIISTRTPDRLAAAIRRAAQRESATRQTL